MGTLKLSDGIAHRKGGSKGFARTGSRNQQCALSPIASECFKPSEKSLLHGIGLRAARLNRWLSIDCCLAGFELSSAELTIFLLIRFHFQRCIAGCGIGPKRIKFGEDRLSELTSFAGNDARVPFAVGRERRERQIGTADDDPQKIIGAVKDIAFGVKPCRPLRAKNSNL